MGKVDGDCLEPLGDGVEIEKCMRMWWILMLCQSLAAADIVQCCLQRKPGSDLQGKGWVNPLRWGSII